MKLSVGSDVISKQIGPVVLVTGPTASGKSDLSFILAKELDGEIVNVDSVQIYRYADIGSAKPSLEERRQVKTHLFDIYDPDQQMNAAVFAEKVRDVARDIIERGKVPILVGSSGLYLSVLLNGLPKLPKRDDRLRAELEEKDSQELYSLLKEREPKIAERLHANDRQRVIRALEISFIGGSTAEKLQTQSRTPYVYGVILVITPERKVLYEKINQRAEEMIRNGIVKETFEIKEKFGSDCVALQSLGYAQVLNLADDARLAEEIAMYTRRYAKRQITFWVNEPAKRDWETFPTPNDKDPCVIGSDETRPKRVFDWNINQLKERLISAIAKNHQENQVFYLKPLR